MSQGVSTLLLRNLPDVFGEIDPVRRRAAIDEIFHEGAVFYDPKGGIYRGRDEIDHIAVCNHSSDTPAIGLENSASHRLA
jgi:hypothetical protein